VHDRRLVVEGSGFYISSIACFHDTFLHSVNHRATPFKDAVLRLRGFHQSQRVAELIPYACLVVVITAPR
jgi:hypothetical protein